ncbi:sulfhydryl oxidase 2-like isoform X2 [Impatiens glandulifera]|uniref:sulfhydryl oxidase 2-like isoform X2 n=1 Tax=Impatiens glandulifera TaxID=253017 RepID=UPI001FB0D3FA|nr:sulfhydryl oxidase 2-like isoform X2 [Impatiens glandulifera]
MSPVSLLFLVFLFTCIATSSPSPLYPGSRSILRAITGNTADPPDFVVDLNITNFASALKDTPATHAVVEFFANWCPACRNYKPQYEKVARLFNGADAIHPGIIYMTRVDCALKANIDLCNRFSISHYPMLFWGPPSKFVSGGSWEPKQDKNEIQQIDDGRTADRLLAWINKKIGSSFSLDDEKFENEHLHSNVSDPGQIARAVYDVEEATNTAFDIIMEHNMIKSETRASLVKFLQVLVAHHPSRRCRKGSAEILVNFDDILPSDILSAKLESGTNFGKYAFKSFNICGKEVPRGYWMFCRGSKNDTRGFSCGLWVLLHSLSVRVDDEESHLTFTAICDFIHNFFICDECRQHFFEMCSSVSTPFKKTRDFAIWLWRTHNKVNERLMEVEESMGTGDPKFPKSQWPQKQLCPSCYLSHSESGNKIVEWNEDEVFIFLVKYYGKMLVSLSKSKELPLEEERRGSGLADELAVSTSAVVVPLGAALAIALASCAFGALACFWRQHQKNRKPRRSWS